MKKEKIFQIQPYLGKPQKRNSYFLNGRSIKKEGEGGKGPVIKEKKFNLF